MKGSVSDLRPGERSERTLLLVVTRRRGVVSGMLGWKGAVVVKIVNVERWQDASSNQS